MRYFNTNSNLKMFQVDINRKHYRSGKPTEPYKLLTSKIKFDFTL